MWLNTNSFIVHMHLGALNFISSTQNESFFHYTFFPFRLYVKGVMQTKVHELGVSGDSVAGAEDSKHFLFHQVLQTQTSKANSADGSRTPPTTPWSSCRHGQGPCKKDALQCQKSVLEQCICLRFWGHWGLQAANSYFAEHVCIYRGKTLLMTR